MPGSRPSPAKCSAEAGAALLAGVLTAGTVLAAETEALMPYRIDGDRIEASLTGRPGDPARGRQVVADRQVGLCLLCHAAPIPEERFQGNIGPDLRGVGARLSDGQIRLRLVDAAGLAPDTVMPSYYVVEGRNRVGQAWRGRPVLSAGQIEDVVAYLATLREP
jgi:sulfur-oxidizing protein SoxX